MKDMRFYSAENPECKFIESSIIEHIMCFIPHLASMSIILWEAEPAELNNK